MEHRNPTKWLDFPQIVFFRRPWFGILVFCWVTPAAKPTYSCCVLFKNLEELFILSAIESINLLSFKTSEIGLSL